MSQPDFIMAIVRRAEELDTGTEDCLNPQHPAGPNFWDMGAAAFRKDVRLEQCPLIRHGPDQDDWLRGWMAAELVEFGSFDDAPESGPGSSRSD